jgi:transposase
MRCSPLNDRGHCTWRDERERHQEANVPFHLAFTLREHPAKSQPQDQAGLRFRALPLIERFFNKIKHFRAIATRYDKLAINFLAAVQLVSAIILLN